MLLGIDRDTESWLLEDPTQSCSIVKTMMRISLVVNNRIELVTNKIEETGFSS